MIIEDRREAGRKVKLDEIRPGDGFQSGGAMFIKLYTLGTAMCIGSGGVLSFDPSAEVTPLKLTLIVEKL